MQITDTEIYTLKPPLGNTLGDARSTITERYWVVVELHTDANQTGTGWLGTWQIPKHYHLYLEDLADVITGTNPLQTETITSTLREKALYYPGEVGFSALPRSAINIALWDIKAQTAGVPLYKLLGGTTPQVPAYWSRLDANLDLETLTSEHQKGVQRGFSAVKTKIGNYPPNRDERRVRAIREAIGTDIDLFVDANQVFTPTAARQILQLLTPHDIGWIEEPLSQWDLNGHDHLATSIDIPLATGEMFYHPAQFQWLLDRQVIGIAQPDLLRCGGISGLRQVSTLAATHDISFVPHIHYVVSAHLVSAAPTGKFVEYIPEYDATPVLDPAPTIQDGTITLPDTPGHGYSIDPTARTQYEITPS